MSSRERVGCTLCGAPLEYFEPSRELECASCGLVRLADARCAGGHFVCDTCHAGDALAVVEHICLSTGETDMLALLRRLRAHPAVPMHGPEHHGIVPGVILATYRNLGGEVRDDAIGAAIRRGFKVPGGFCGRAGTCGAATGVGVAFATLLGSSPVKADERQTSMRVTARVLNKLSEHAAARCCQRDAWMALREAAAISAELLPIRLRAEAEWRCEQFERNKECLEQACPLRPSLPSPGGRM